MAKAIFLAAVFFLIADSSWGQNRLTVGASLGNSVVHVGKKSQLSGGAHNTASGKLISENSFGLLAGMKSAFSPILESNFGYTVDVMIESFSVSKQVVPRAEKKKQMDLGTAVEGYTITATPILRYNINFLETHNVYLGVGIGFGYLDINGNLYLTENSDSTACADSQTSGTIQQNCDSNEIAVGEFTYSLGWAIGYEGDHFATLIKRTAPQLKDSETAYTIWTLSWEVYYFF